ncbi:MAG TPA: alpha/beta hydrolase [Opitutaceae bacterium]|nr:alpha/beta hydrolase [Opitutaceae bacterium]
MKLAAYQHYFHPATDPAAPPLLLLHGTGGSERDLIPFAHSLSPRSALLAPRGDVLENGAPRFFRRIAEGVFDLEDVRRRTHALADWLIAASRHYGIPSDQLMALGYSNGANVAATMLLLRPEMLGGGVLMRSMVVLEAVPAPEALRGRRVLLLNGTHDPVVPPDHPPRLAALLRTGGAAVTVRSHAAGHGLTQVDLKMVARWLHARRMPRAVVR